MKITILTLFKDMFYSMLDTSIIKRAIEKDFVEIELVDIRDFSNDKHGHVDDTIYGGGAGMLIRIEPVLNALNSVRTKDSYVILCAPIGTVYKQEIAKSLSKKEHIIIICGHYEGFDARLYKYVDNIISIGDYVLTGGELAAMVIVDSVVRLVDGVIKEDSKNFETFENNLLEHPQYTKPFDYNGDKVPEVLISGHHENIRKYNLKESLLLTKKYRSDLFEKHKLTKEEEELLKI